MRFWILMLLLALSGCDCNPPVEPACTSDTQCEADETCADEVCVPRSELDGGMETDSGGPGVCDDTRPRCGSVCCSADRVCSAGSCELDCGGSTECAGMCCGAGEVCEADRCLAECAPENTRCGASDELCCTGAQACLQEACVDLGDACTLTEECPVDAVCLPSLGRCVNRDSVDVCEFRPPIGEFTPRVACQWRPPAAYPTYNDVVMTPSVMNLTDDNEDGATDRGDIPDIVFIAFDREGDGCCAEEGRVVIASGACNADGSMTTHAVIDSPFVGNSSGIALGNLHPDSMADERTPEIVATFAEGGTIAWRRTAADGSAWEELWRNNQLVNRATRGNAHGTQPAIADLDGDGQPEVIVGNVVLNGLTGATIWNGRQTVGPTAGVGWNAFVGPASTVADLDLDGDMEVIAGNTVYDGMTGEEVWTFDFGATNGGNCDNTGVVCDGFNGVGNFDDDPQGEVVIIRQGEAFVIEHDGVLKHRVLLPNGGDPDNESGPPTIADFDGDGRPEIGTAGSRFYIVLDFDCTGSPLPTECESENILWTVANDDDSSRATGSSVFDFEGDGAAEVIYADETSFRIFDGRTGAALYTDDTHRSNTRMEMPIVVDVDNDGKSEVVIPEPNNSGDPSLGGIEIWEDADNNWVRTRRVWNQHTYHVTNVDEDGQIPRQEEPNWSNGRLNNFRQNVQPGGLFDAPDLQVEVVALGDCESDGTVRIDVTVVNRGALGVAAGINVVARATLPDGTVVELGVAQTSTFLLPGQSEVVSFTHMFAGGFTFDDFTVTATVDDDGTGAGAYNECIEDNNEAMSELLETCSFG